MASGAASKTDRVRASLSRRASAAAFSAVTFRVTPTKPVTAPASPRRGTREVTIHPVSPS